MSYMSKVVSDAHVESKSEVLVYVYEMMNGRRLQLFSSVFLEKKIPGMFHTSVVVYDSEFFYGYRGVNFCCPGHSMIGKPDRILMYGEVCLPRNCVSDCAFYLSSSRFAPKSYDLFSHNCNHFTNEFTLILTGSTIPEEIMEIPRIVLETAAGKFLKAFFHKLHTRKDMLRRLMCIEPEQK